MTKLRLAADLALPAEWICMAGGPIHEPGPRMRKPYTVGEVAERIWARVAFAPEPECWLWIGGLRNGYGFLSLYDHPRYTHRLVYAMYVSDIGEDQVVCHRCDTPACVNPSHLFLGTQAENVADMDAKGRARKVGRSGPRHHRFRVTDELVTQVRQAWEAEHPKQRDLAARFGLTQATVWQIVNCRGRFAEAS